MKNIYKYLSLPWFGAGLSLVCLLIFSCAKQGIPPGGPEDRRGPTILASDPIPNSVGVSPTIKPLFQFDEYVDRASLEAATFISPFPEGKVRFKWKGKSVRLVFPEPLRPDLTYVVTIGTGVKDMRGNPLPWAFNLAFSTGDHLDRAAVSGRICDSLDSKSPTQVWAYDLSVNPEPDPGAIGPDYVTQSNETGNFQFTNLRPATYRIFAINDRRRNRRWEPNEDRIGVAFLDVTTAQDSVAPEVNLKMTLRDTTGARITSVRVPDQRHVTLRFSKPVQPQNISSRNQTTAEVLIRDSLDVELQVISLFPDPMDSLYWKLTTDSQTPEHRYFLWAEGFLDRNDNPNSQDSVAFEGSSVLDTLGPHLLSFTPEDLERDMPDKPKIRLIFDEEIVTDSLSASVSEKDGIPLPYAWNIEGSSLWMIPEDSVAGKTIYAGVRLTSVHDPMGNSGLDSMLMWQFSVIPRDTLGEIRGQVIDPEMSATGPVVIEAHRLDLRQSSWQGWWKIDAAGKFILPWLLPGKYQLQAFRDEDQSGDFSYGYPYPYSYSERFVISPDTITIRSRWETTGITLTLPSRTTTILQPLPPDTMKVTP